jgi:hypothetical protein
MLFSENNRIQAHKVQTLALPLIGDVRAFPGVLRVSIS